MSNELDNIEKQVSGGRNYDAPPLHLWHPELSGDIDIRIAVDGSWYHEGEKISREAIVRLFSSILRREDDGEYYLVTPGEKWRIQVELHPLLVTDVSWREGGEDRTLQATLNTGKVVNIDQHHPLFLEPVMDNVAAIKLPHGLVALFSRNAWYRLVEMAQHRQGQVVLVSGGQSYSLS